MFAPLCVPRGPRRAARGGWRQRYQAYPEGELRPAPLLALGHLLKWGEGVQCARQLVWHMSHAIDDGEVTHPMVHNLGRLASTSQSGSVARTLLRVLEPCGFSSIIRENPPGGVVTHWIPPSRMLGFLHARFPDRVCELLGLNEDALGDFWVRFRRGCPEADAHLATHRALAGLSRDDFRRVVPLAIHEDAGPFTKRSSTNVLSFSSLMGAGGKKVCNYQIATYVKTGALDGATLGDLWHPILEDFEQLTSRGIGGLALFLALRQG